MPEIRNKIDLEVTTKFFRKISAKSTNFEVSILGLGVEFKVYRLCL